MLEQERRVRAAGGIGIGTIAVIFSMISILVVGGGTQRPGAANAATSGRTYYVDSAGGNDTNSGTSASSAWRTLSKANSAPLVPGDQLLLRRGDTWTGSLQIIKSGTGAAPIMFDAYGTGAAPLITGPGTCIAVSGSYVVVRDLHADSCSWAGIAIAGDGDRADGNMSTDNVVGVSVQDGSTGAVIVHNELRDNNKMSVLTKSPSNDDSGAFGVLLHGDDAEIAYNTISGSSAFSYDYGLDGSAVEIYGGRGNYIHDNLAVGDDAFAELGNSRSADNTFTYNVYRSTLSNSIFLITRGANSSLGPVQRTIAENNSVLLTGSSSQGFVCYAGCTGSVLRLRNNIFQAVWKCGYADGAFDEDYDLFYGGILQFARGAHSRVAPPRFVDPSTGDLHLQATSPAIDAGISVGLTSDFDGRSVPVDGNGDGVATPDMGAFEYRR
jgi:hypothetical protein